MPAPRKLARTSKILGLAIAQLSVADVRDRRGRPIKVVADEEHLHAVLMRLASRVAAGTARTYRPFIVAWWSLCERRDAELGDDALLRGWLMAMTRGTHAWSFSSAQVAMAAITSVRGLLGLSAPLADHAFHTWFSGELAAPLAAPPARKAPLLRKALLFAVKHLAGVSKRPEPALRLAAIRDRALILLGFSAALRRSEIVGVGVDDIQASAAGGTVLRIRTSKTDQRRQGHLIPLYQAANPLLDVMKAVAAWQSAAHITKGPLFRRIDRHGQVGRHALNPAAVAQILRRLKLGDNISPHSLRRGFITEARLAGASNVQIRRVSRHKSDHMLDTYTADVDAHVQGPGAIV